MESKVTELWKPIMKLFFATDLHGSTVAFKKFLAAKRFYGADVLILGGDLTGKGIIPIVRDGNKVKYTLYGKHFECRGEAEIRKAESIIENIGFYPLRVSQREKQNLDSGPVLENAFEQCIRRQIEMWEQTAAKAGSPIYLIPGNDDIILLDRLLNHSRFLINCDRRTVELPERWELVGFGGSNMTPWNTYREYAEDEIQSSLDNLMKKVPKPERCIWNVHVPPAKSGLDVCESIDERFRVITRLGEPELQPVGSFAVDQMIRKWQPSLALFGHVHESRGWVRIGKTLCINPGSEYYVGTLSGCLVHLSGSEIKTFQLTRG